MDSQISQKLLESYDYDRHRLINIILNQHHQINELEYKIQLLSTQLSEAEVKLSKNSRNSSNPLLAMVCRNPISQVNARKVARRQVAKRVIKG